MARHSKTTCPAPKYTFRCRLTDQDAMLLNAAADAGGMTPSRFVEGLIELWVDRAQVATVVATVEPEPARWVATAVDVDLYPIETLASRLLQVAKIHAAPPDDLPF